MAQVRQQPIKEAGLLARQYPQVPLVMWGVNLPSFSVYSARIVDRRAPRPGEVVLTKTARLSELGPHEMLYQRHGIALVRMSSESAGRCVAGVSACPSNPGILP